MEMKLALIDEGGRGMKNRFRHMLFLGLVLLLVGGVVLSSTFYSGRPQPSRDFRAELNRPFMQIPEQDKAWRIYRDLWIQFDFGEGGKGTFDELYTPLVAGQKRRLVRPADGEPWRVAVAKLASCPELLEGFRTAAQCPLFGLPNAASVKDMDPRDVQALYPKSYKSLLVDAEISALADPYVPLTQSISSCLLIAQKMPQLLIVDSRWAMEQGDSERITRNVEAIFGMARQINDQGRLMDGLLAVAFSSIGIDLIDECVHANVEFDDRQLERLATAVQQTRMDEIFRYSSERLLFEDLIQHSYTDNGFGDGRITWRGLEVMDEAYDPRQFEWSPDSAWTDQLRSIPLYIIAPSSMLRYATRKQLTEKSESLFDRVDEYLFAPLTDDASRAFEIEVAELPASYRPIQRFMQYAVNYKSRVLQCMGDRSGAIGALAVLRFQRQNGTLPTTLEEMVGTFLAEIPRDPVDGHPLRYEVQNAEFFIYSVGGNARDDGGMGPMSSDSGTVVPVPLTKRHEPGLRPLAARAYDLDDKQPGDWILWPRYSAEAP